MVAYFKRQNNLFMLAGALLGLLAAWLARNGVIKDAGFAKPFMIALIVIIGIVAGRIFASLWASRKLKALNALLYGKAQPEEFIRRFSPIVERTPKETVEYVDGCCKLAYAYEALGEFEKGLNALKGLKPEQLKLHSLAGTALVTNQRARLYLMTEDTENVKPELTKLAGLESEAAMRAPSLAAGLKDCVKLCQTWLSFLEGGALDCDYIKEEISLAKNLIHKNEMRLLLAKAELAAQDTAAAKVLLNEIRGSGTGLYSQGQAEILLQKLP